MGWDDSDTLAIVALVISLVALLVAYVQFNQSSSLTAEGSKQCGSNNIGKWSVYSKKTWSWLDLRYDVEYTTPEIFLLDATEYSVEVAEKGNKTSNGLDEYLERCIGAPGIDAEVSNETQKANTADDLVHEKPNQAPDIEGQPLSTGSRLQGRSFTDESRFTDEFLWSPRFKITASHTTEEEEEEEEEEEKEEDKEIHILGLTNDLHHKIEKSWDKIRERWATNEASHPKVPLGESEESMNSGSIWYKIKKGWAKIRERWTRKRWFWTTKTNALGKLTRRVPRASAPWDDFLYRLYEQQYEALQWTTRNLKRDIRKDEKPSVFQIFGVEVLVGIRLQPSSWCFLPSDTVRPPAQSSLGDVILLAQYLGMTWQECDPTRQSYQAFGRYGRGLHMSSSVVQGLGIVFQFDAIRKTQFEAIRKPEKVALIQMLKSQDANKMFFGIIPAVKEKELNTPEIKAVNRNGEIDWRHLLHEDLQLPPSQQLNWLRDNRSKSSCAIKNDLLPLLAPFMPLEDCPFVRINNPIPLGGILENSKHSFFADRECHKVLQKALEAKLKRDENSFAGRKKDLEKLLNDFSKIPSFGQGSDDGSIRLFVSNDLAGTNPDWQNARDGILSTVTILREIHKATTEYFQKDCSFPYMDMVRTHVLMATDCIRSRKRGSQLPSNLLQDVLLTSCNLWPERLPDHMEKVSKTYTRPDKLDDSLECSWWFLMIRAIAWRLSVEILVQDTPKLVPSWLYNNPALVWIA